MKNYFTFLNLSIISFLLIFGGAAANIFFTPITAQAATNLITNGNFESSSTGSTPNNWIRGNWGTNTAVFSYPVTGPDSSKASEVTLTSRTSGDAKWAHNPVAVTPGQTYTYTNSYKSTVPTFVTLEYTKSDGTKSYIDLGQPGASSSWTTASFNFIVPAGVTKVSVFHLINRVGTLTIDNASLINTTPSSSPSLIGNHSFEVAGNSGNPTGWIRGRWGTNTASFSYPVSGINGANAAQVSMNTHSSGDAKWAHDPVAVTPGQAYEFSNRYKSNVATYVTVQFRTSGGATSYKDIGSASPSSSWQEFNGEFMVPAGVTSVSIFHVIKNVGTLTVDNYILKKAAGDPTKLDKGYVSLHFDDGHRSVYHNALPILDSVGFKSDQFITTSYVLGSFPGYMTEEMVRDTQRRGHLIGAHTRNHVDLTTLSPAEAYNEIRGSRDDLLAMGVSPVNYFAYPFGAYNSTVQQIVMDSGFAGARSSDGGFNDKTTDIYALKRQSMTNATTISQVKNLIDKAEAEKTWLVLLFHQVDSSGRTFAVTPDFLSDTVNYLQQKNMTPITMNQGLSLIKN